MKLLPKIEQIIRYGIVTLLFCLVPFTPAFCMNNHFSFDLNGQSMAEVAGLISKQLNYKILMDEDLTKVTVSGKYENVTLQDFFSKRIFRGNNIIVLYDDDNRVIEISSFGKKNRMIEYNQTSYYKLKAASPPGTGSSEMEIQPGIKRRDAVFLISTIAPMDQEIQPGIKRRDVTQVKDNTDPIDREIQPGIKRRDVVENHTIRDPMTVEIQPGIKRKDAIFSTLDLDPQDIEVQPGIKRRDTRGLTE